MEGRARETDKEETEERREAKDERREREGGSEGGTHGCKKELMCTAEGPPPPPLSLELGETSLATDDRTEAKEE